MKLAENVNLNIIKTNKYKDVNIYFRFSSAVDFYENIVLSLLLRMIGESSEQYKSKEEMARIKDNLYAASVINKGKTLGDGMVFTIHYDFLNPCFAKGITLEDYFSFIKETLFHVHFSENDLEEYKRNAIDHTLRTLDKPQNYAKNQVHKYISSRINSFKIYDFDQIDLIKQVTIDDVKNAYKKMLETFRLDIYILGDVSEETYLPFIQSLGFKDRHPFVPHIQLADDVSFEDQVEEKEISQSYFNILFKTPFHSLHEDFFAWVIGNTLLGNAPNSFLFEEVREKRGLCYSIGVIDYKLEGFVRIQTAINGKDAAEVKDIVLAQIKRLIDKDYKPEQLEMVKQLFKNIVLSSNDDVDQYISYISTNDLFNRPLSLEEYSERIMAVSQDDVSNIFKAYQYAFSYLLKGGNESEDL